MEQGWLFDPGKPARPRAHRRPSRPRRETASHVAESRRHIEPPPDPGPTLHERLTLVFLKLQHDDCRGALDLLDELQAELEGDAIYFLLRAWALAGTGGIEEAEELLMRGELHRGRSAWQTDHVLQSARLRLAQAKREARPATKPKHRKPLPRRAKRKSTRAQRASGPPAPTLPAPAVTLRTSLSYRTAPPEVPEAEACDPAVAFEDYRTRGVAVRIAQLRRYDTLLSLGAAQGVDRYEYQLRTVRRVLRDFRGRALLADEVGLGKTIEAALCLEEYLQRGLAKRALLLVPPGLLQQWRDELRGKFGREATIVTGARARRDPELWAREPLLLTSTALARRKPHAERIAAAGFDMVIVDEAHRLKNRRTLLWRLVDKIRARYLLLLSATPVENDLLEIYNVLSLLRPGLFSTQAAFRRRFMRKGSRKPKDADALRDLLRQVMIRNTRAASEANLPPRFATTLRAEPRGAEAVLLRDLDRALRQRLEAGLISRFRAGEILRAVGARPQAAAALIERHLDRTLAQRAREVGTLAKDDVLADLLGRRKDDKVIVFASHVDSVEHVVEVARRAGRRPVRFRGSLSPVEKARALEAFRERADVLVATESGGEGFNLHFARTVVNYDLPWNPMRIEQRIGRVHRIGQEREVFVFNLVAAGTIEEEILRVLDEKIDMFELVVGEVEAILGRLGDDEREFAELVLDIYAGTSTKEDMRRSFDELAEKMIAARRRHAEVVAYEDEVFGRELEA